MAKWHGLVIKIGFFDPAGEFDFLAPAGQHKAGLLELQGLLFI